MKLLALETATEACSAAIWVEGAVLERYELAPRRHAALILPMVEAVLAEAGLAMSRLDAIAVGCGPGAFTGVRIAIGIAQGLAFAVDAPVAPISTLATLVSLGRLDLSRSISEIVSLEDVAIGIDKLERQEGNPIRILVRP